MTLSALVAWLDAHALQIAAALGAAAAAWKALPQAARARIEARFPRVAGAARFVAAVGPDLLGAVRIARYQIAAGQPRPRAIVPPPLPDLRDRASGGYAAPAALLFAAAAVALALAGCPLPPPDGCTPLATRCSPEGVPQSCSPSQRWTSGALQRPCAQRAAGSVCCRARSPYGTELYACVPQSACLPESVTDAGAEGGDQ